MKTSNEIKEQYVEPAEKFEERKALALKLAVENHCEVSIPLPEDGRRKLEPKLKK